MDTTDWNTHVNHPLQTWEWGEFRKKMGITVARENNYQITFHRIPYTPFTVGYMPKGPSPTHDMIATLKKIGKENNAIYIQLEPNIVVNPLKGQPYNGIIPSHHPLFTKYTFILDLTKTEEELLEAMHSKTRYNIKVAVKHDVIVKEDNSDKAFEEYLRLEKETTERQGFFAHNEEYHRTMWNIMKQHDIARLWTATYKGTVLSAWIIFVFGDTIYYPYGTSSRLHREVMAPTLLLWEIARWGMKNGYKKFDLWGALGPKPDEKDPWYGFHRFKEGFSPNLVEFIGSYDLVLNKPLYFLFTLIDKLRWMFLRKTI